MQAGVALLLGGMLLAAGLPKAVAPWYVASALRRVIGVGSDRGLRLYGRLLGIWELALGSSLLLVGGGRAGVLVAALAALTFTLFVGFVVLAIRRGAACGCWASLSEGPAGGAELGRAVFLAALAADLFLDRLLSRHTPAHGGVSPEAPYVDLWRIDGWQSLAWAAGLLAGTHLAVLLGGALMPVHTPELRRQLGAQAAPGVLGRLGAELTLLGGFVHAGTHAGRRRYITARLAAATPVDAPPAASPPVPVPRAATLVRRSRMALPPRPPAEALTSTEGSTR